METDNRWGQITQLPLLWFSIAFLLGILLARLVGAPTWFWSLAAAGALALLLALRRLENAQRLLLLAALLLSLGALRYYAAQPSFSEDDLAFYNDATQRVAVHGVLIRPPVYRDAYVELWVRAETLTVGETSLPVSGQVLARADFGGGQWRYGDGVELLGRLRTPSETEEFSYREYLARQGVYSEMPFAAALHTGGGHGNWLRGGLYAVRQHSLDVLHRLYPDPEAGLLAGILLGDESGIPPGLKEAFNDTGTRHIVAISGFNVSIIAGLFLAVFARWAGRRRGIWLAAAGILVYTILVGAQASIVRAAIMGVIALAAQLIGRDQFGLNTLAFTGALMALVNPLVLWDVGFQLSFTATLGLILYGERLKVWSASLLERRLPPKWAARLEGPLYDYVLLTLAAQLLTLPLLLHHFGRLSLVSMPANVLILPLQPAVMIFGGLSLLAGSLWLMFGQALALLAWPVAALSIRIAEWFASPPWAAYNVTAFTPFLVLLYYFAVVVATLPAARAVIKSIPLRPILPALALAAFSFWSWGLVASRSDGLLHITLLDLDGEAVLVRTPAGRNLLINGGPSAVELASQLGRHLPPFARQLDWLLILGERTEQINGLQTGVERLQIAQVAWATAWPSDDYRVLISTLEELNFPLTELQLNQRLELGDGVTLELIGLGPRGASALLSWRNFQALLPVGLDFDQMREMEANPVPGLDLLLLADAGDPPVNTPAWLAAMDARVHWLSADGVFSDDLLRALGSRTLLSAAQLGWLQATTDGETLWISAERNWPGASVLMQP